MARSYHVLTNSPVTPTKPLQCTTRRAGAVDGVHGAVGPRAERAQRRPARVEDGGGQHAQDAA
eukprot:2640626-Pyramimonas_sp.AAC.1